jgi:S1-C subfamily serine protease
MPGKAVRLSLFGLACALFAGGPALGQKPPPLGVPDGGAYRRGGPTEAGLPGKPPPLGAPEPDSRVRPEPRGEAGLPPPGQRPSSSGTGFVVAERRVLTNNHVVADCGRLVVRNAAGTRVPGRVAAVDRRRDLALVAVPTDIGPALLFRDSPPVRRGESVVTYGFPLSGLLSSGPTLTTGDINALAGLRDNPANFQISAPVQPGNSGGPLLDSQANVIGVVVSKLNAARIAEMTGGDIPQNVNFAVKGTEALAFLRANGVQPRTAGSTGADKRVFEIGDVANPSTVSIQCYN